MSRNAAWQREMMAAHPETCWCFVAPDRVCVLATPCPKHAPSARADFFDILHEHLDNMTSYGVRSEADRGYVAAVVEVRRFLRVMESDRSTSSDRASSTGTKGDS